MVSTRPSRSGGKDLRTASKKSKSASDPLGVKSPKEEYSGKRASSIEATPKTAPRASKKEKVRVWWPPTKDKLRTGFSGAHWPAVVISKGKDYYQVKYDNGDEEKVHIENIFPSDVPVEFGEEEEDLQVGEFVDVSNGSKSDPCAWLGCVASVGDKAYKIIYPFHDTPPELIKPKLLRRARVSDQKAWKLIEVGQKWKSGEVTSPLELTLLKEKEYFRALKNLPAPNKTKEEGSGKKSKGEGSARKSKEEPSSKRSRKIKEEPESEEDTSTTSESSKGAKEEQPKSASTKKRKTEKESPPAPPPALLPAVTAPDLATLNFLTAPPAAQTTGQVTSTVPFSGLPGAQGLPLEMSGFQGLNPQGPGAMHQMYALPASMAGVNPHMAMMQLQLQSAAAAARQGSTMLTLMPGAVPPGQRPPGMAPQGPPMGPLVSMLATATSGGMEEAKKKKKDPNAPKKAMTPFEAFKAQAREGLMAQNEGMLPKEANTRLREMWDKMTDEERGPYKVVAMEDKDRYSKEMGIYHPEGEEAGQQAGKKRKRERDPDAPSKAKTAYILFIVDYRKQLGKSVDFNEATKLCAEAWKNAPDNIKEHYRQLAHLEKVNYERKKAEYEAKKRAEEAARPAVPQQPMVQLGPSIQPLHPAWSMGSQGQVMPPQQLTGAMPGMMPPPVLSTGQSDKTGPVTTGAPGGVPPAMGVSPFSAVAPAAILPEQHLLQGPPGAPGLNLQAPAGSMVVASDQSDDLVEVMGKLDLQRAKEALKKHYMPDAYMLLLDVWRRDSAKVQDAVLSFKAHVQGYGRPDWRAFMVGIFGLEKMRSLEKAEKVAIEVEPPKA